MKYLFIVIISALFFSCDSNKLNCYNSEMTIMSESKDFVKLMEKARRDIPLLKGENGLNIFNDSSYIDSATIDNAVFFNSNRSKCVLLILQQTAKDLYSDHVYIIQGTVIDGKWIFKQSRLPDVPEITYTVRKSGPRQKPVNSSFKKLSEKGRLFVLTAGTVKAFGCDIDQEYWFGSEM